MRVLTLDPGGTTGYCTADLTNNDLLNIRVAQLNVPNHHATLWTLLNKFKPEVLISESFEYRNQSRAGLVLVSKEYIGVAKLWYQLNDSSEYIEQSPGVAKSFVADAHIKKLGLWVAGKPHAMDALRHMIYYTVNGNHSFQNAKLNLLRRGYKT